MSVYLSATSLSLLFFHVSKLNWSWSGFNAGSLSGPGSHHAVPSLGIEVGFSMIYSWLQRLFQYNPLVCCQFYLLTFFGFLLGRCGWCGQLPLKFFLILLHLQTKTLSVRIILSITAIKIHSPKAMYIY